MQTFHFRAKHYFHFRRRCIIFFRCQTLRFFFFSTFLSSFITLMMMKYGQMLITPMKYFRLRWLRWWCTLFSSKMIIDYELMWADAFHFLFWWLFSRNIDETFSLFSLHMYFSFHYVTFSHEMIDVGFIICGEGHSSPMAEPFLRHFFDVRPKILRWWWYHVRVDWWNTLRHFVGRADASMITQRCRQPKMAVSFLFFWLWNISSCLPSSRRLLQTLITPLSMMKWWCGRRWCEPKWCFYDKIFSPHYDDYDGRCFFFSRLRRLLIADDFIFWLMTFLSFEIRFQPPECAAWWGDFLTITPSW